MSHSHRLGLYTQNILKLPWEFQPPLDCVSYHKQGKYACTTNRGMGIPKPDEGIADRAKAAKPCEEMEEKKRKFQNLHTQQG